MSGRIVSHVRSQWAGFLALFLVLTGGTAMATFVINSNSEVGPDTISGHKPPASAAANIIAGSVSRKDLASKSVGSAQIVDGDVTGADVADNSLNNADIDEGTLGLASGRSLFHAVALNTVPDSWVVADRFTMDFTCATQVGTPSQISFTNHYADTMNLFIDDGGANPSYHSLTSGDSASVSTVGTVNQGDRFVFAWQVGGGQFGTVSVDMVDRVTDCHFEAQGFLNA